jgi:hypothetical protein
LPYRIPADLVIILHFSFIVYAVLGGLLGLWRKWCLFFHLPAVVWAAIVEFQSWICPLTPLENYLRSAAGLRGYQDGFVEHYLAPVVYPPSLSNKMQWIHGGLVVAVNIIIYWFVFTQRKESSRKGAKFAKKRGMTP